MRAWGGGALWAFCLPWGRVRREGVDRSLTRAPQPEDEEDEEPALEELEQREVLVLGLDGSGKSTFLRVLAGKPPLEGHIPTWGFNSVRLPTKDFEVDLLESEQIPLLAPPPTTHKHRLPIMSAGPKPGILSKSRTHSVENPSHVSLGPRIQPKLCILAHLYCSLCA